MLEIRTSLSILICLWVCQMQAQEVFISSEIPVQLGLNGSLSKNEKTNWRIPLRDTNHFVIGVFSGDSISIEKGIHLGNIESYTYQFERSATGQHKLFYRSNLRPTGELDNLGKWSSDSSLYRATRLAPRLSLDVPDQLIEKYKKQDSLRPQLVIEPPIDEFKIALEQLSGISFEYERVQQIIEWGEKNNPSTRQILQLTELSSFDPSRLMILEQLFPHCIDPQNYTTLEVTLQYSASKEAFNTWLSEWKELQ